MNGPGPQAIAPLVLALLRAGVLLAACVPAARGRRGGAVRVLLALGALALALSAAWPRSDVPYDLKRFWLAGRDLNRGVDYYARPADDPSDPILNPPTILPLFRVLALMPLPTAAAWWNGFGVLAGLAIVPAATAAIRAQGTTRGSAPGSSDVVLLSAAVGVSCAQGMGLALGQVATLAALAIAMAVRAQGLGRPVSAGLWLAVATIKAHTMAPFLLLFLRRRDWPTWPALAAGGLLLAAAGGPLEDLPRRCARTLEVIAATHRPGAVNDFTAAGPSHASLIGLDPLLHRLGVSGRGVITIARNAILGGAGLALAWAVLRRRVDRPTACALTALYASVFLYHRLYDAVILTIPIAWGLTTPGRRLVAAACLAVLFVDPEGLLIVEAWAHDGGWPGTIAGAAMLPIATWGIALAAAATRDGRARHRPSLFAARGRGTEQPPPALPGATLTSA